MPRDELGDESQHARNLFWLRFASVAMLAVALYVFWPLFAWAGDAAGYIFFGLPHPGKHPSLLRVIPMAIAGLMGHVSFGMFGRLGGAV